MLRGRFAIRRICPNLVGHAGLEEDVESNLRTRDDGLASRRCLLLSYVRIQVLQTRGWRRDCGRLHCVQRSPCGPLRASIRFWADAQLDDAADEASPRS